MYVIFFCQEQLGQSKGDTKHTYIPCGAQNGDGQILPSDRNLKLMSSKWPRANSHSFYLLTYVVYKCIC